MPVSIGRGGWKLRAALSVAHFLTSVSCLFPLRHGQETKALFPILGGRHLPPTNSLPFLVTSPSSVRYPLSVSQVLILETWALLK